MCHGLPPGPSMTLWDIPALSLLGRGEVQTRKPSFERSLDHLLPSAWFKTPLPNKSFCFFKYKQLLGEGKKGYSGRGWEQSCYIL